MHFGKRRHDTAHDTPDVELLLHTRRLLMHGIDCAVPKYSVDTSPPQATPAIDAFTSTTAGAFMAWDFGQWCCQQLEGGAPSLATKAPNDAGAMPSSPSFDAGSAIDALLHDAAHPRNCPLPLGDTCPPGAGAGPPVLELPWSTDPFHGDWPHW